MTDPQIPNPQPPQSSPADGWLEPGKGNIQLIYVLYLVGFIVGLTPIIGLVMAYLNRSKASGWQITHYDWIIRTFWIGLLYGLISFLLMFIGIGLLLMLAVAVWVIVRCVLGLQAAAKSEPMKNPSSWLI